MTTPSSETPIETPKPMDTSGNSPTTETKRPEGGPCPLCVRLSGAPRTELDDRFSDVVKFTSGFFRKNVRQLATGKWQKIPLHERDGLLWALAHASGAESQHTPERTT